MSQASSPTPIFVGDEGETPVRVPMEGVEGPPGLGKRPRENNNEFVDVDEEDDPVPTEKVDPEPPQAENTTKEPEPPLRAEAVASTQAARALTLQDILDAMNNGFATQQTNMTTLRREVSDIQKDTQEAKGLSAKAVTLANETKESLTALEKRVAALEAGDPPASARSAAPSQPPLHKGDSKRDFDLLGGEEGDTIVLGGFRNWADKEERKQEWALIEPNIPAPLRESIAEVIIPQLAMPDHHCQNP